MKKVLIALLTILVLSTVAIFVFIPSRIKISHSVFIHTTDRWASNYIADTSDWTKWFPTKKDSAAPGFNLNGITFSLDSSFYNAFKINMQYKGDDAGSVIHLLSLKRDSLAVLWESELTGGWNPAHRLAQYGFALQMKKSMATILDSFGSYMNKSENVYGTNIKVARIPDSVLVSTKAIFPHYPSDEEVHGLMQQLFNHIAKYHVKQNGKPMLHISETEEGKYQTQVAIPIEKDVPETGDIKMKYMPIGSTLLAEVTGGHYTINKGLEALHQYKNDFGFISPAIPFQYMMTNRLEERDTSKWITRLYYPVK